MTSPSAYEGRAPVPGDQAPVWLCESALPWPGQEYGADDDAVRALESVDGPSAFIE